MQHSQVRGEALNLVPRNVAEQSGLADSVAAHKTVAAARDEAERRLLNQQRGFLGLGQAELGNVDRLDACGKLQRAEEDLHGLARAAQALVLGKRALRLQLAACLLLFAQAGFRHVDHRLLGQALGCVLHHGLAERRGSRFVHKRILVHNASLPPVDDNRGREQAHCGCVRVVDAADEPGLAELRHQRRTHLVRTVFVRHNLVANQQLAQDVVERGPVGDGVFFGHHGADEEVHHICVQRHALLQNRLDFCLVRHFSFLSLTQQQSPSNTESATQAPALSGSKRACVCERTKFAVMCDGGAHASPDFFCDMRCQPPRTQTTSALRAGNLLVLRGVINTEKKE
eukprot:m.142855 g.142855  ORF g.142855 m.142855 type:complete len:342 (-) comp16723_c0_seq1:579-1604(-)